MRSFNVLDQDLSLHKSYVLQASAGTGKTFAIENIFARLLIEGEESVGIDQILVVTFTRKATKELQLRIYSRLEDLLTKIESLDENGPTDQQKKELPPFLKGLSTEKIWLAKRRLLRALCRFHEASIFTIHSFCMKALSEHGPFEKMESMTPMERLEVIRDFLLSQVSKENYSPAQLTRLLAKHGFDDEKLCEVISQNAWCLPDPGMSYEQAFQLYCQTQKDLCKGVKNLDRVALKQDFLSLCSLYKGVCKKDGSVKEEIEKKMDRFCLALAEQEPTKRCFDYLIEDGMQLFSLFSSGNTKKKRPQDPVLHYSGFIVSALQKLHFIIEQASDYAYLLARLVFDCHQRIRQVQEEKELLDSDQLLVKMAEAIGDPLFVRAVQQQYRFALIDEFQDTDPIQWKIFQKLFLCSKNKNCLYLVGDPKQSIYGFRNADIYTYLDAIEQVGEENLYSLQTNYRSSKELVKALNTLFSLRGEQFMPLPKKELFLPYHPVVAADQQEGIDSCPIEFILGEAKEGRGEKWPTAEVEKQLFFPRIAEQIQLLAASGTPFSDQAILVKDRYQAQRVAEFLQEHNIASLLQRSELLTNTEAFLDVEIILQATLDRAEGFVQALSTRLFGWDSERLFAVKKQMESDPWKVASVAVPFHRFLQVLHESGVGAWYRAVLDETGAVEGLLQQKGGEEYLDAFTQVVEALVRYQTTTGARGHALLCGFEQIQQWVQNEEPEGFLRPLMDSSAVSILTLHASKGLEFPVVFALGVINRTSMQHPLLRSADRLVVASDKEKTRPFFQEIDAEKLRQLYVALTRAKKKLYIPVLFALDAKKPPLSGQASAMELLLSQIAEGKQKESFQQWLSSYPFFGVVDPISDLPDTPKQVQSQELFVPKEVHWQKEGRKILSFSGLARSSSLHREEKLSVSVTNPLQVEESPCSFLSKEQLPAGTQTGKALHAIFEKIPWGKQALPWLDTDEGKACLGKLWPYKEVIASVVDRVFSAPLHPFSWCLQDVLPEDVAREMEFVYQEGKNYVKGFVDTIFLYQDRYWIVDWKSNVLDPDLPCKTAVQQKMEEHQYFLQAAIYQKAMNKHLAQHDPLQRKIGGAFYIFIRANSPDGIVFLPAKEQKKSH